MTKEQQIIANEFIRIVRKPEIPCFNLCEQAATLIEQQAEIIRKKGAVNDGLDSLIEQQAKEIEDLEQDKKILDWIERHKVNNVLSQRMACYFVDSTLHDSFRKAVLDAMAMQANAEAVKGTNET